MSTRSYRARNAALARWHRAAYEAEKLATVDTTRPRHILASAVSTASENPFVVGDMVRWQGETSLEGEIIAVGASRVTVQVMPGCVLYPRINQLVRAE